MPPLLLAVLAACTPVSDLELVASEAVPTVVTASFTTDRATRPHLRFGPQGSDLALASPEGPEGTDHELVLLGLKAGVTHEVQVVDEDGAVLAEAILEVAPPPADLASMQVSDWDPARAEPSGYVLTSQMSTDKSYAAIMDRDGDWVWFWPAEERLSIPTARPSVHGGVAFTHNDANQATDLGGTARVDLQGTNFQLTRNYLGHHDFVELPDGTVAWLSIDIREAEVDGEVMDVGADTILEAPLGTDDPDAYTEVFNFFDDYGRDPWRTCEHFDAELFSTGARDWTHCNSLIYDADADDYLLMCKNIDALLRIDRGTGEVVWQMGGEDSDFDAHPKHWWSHAHMSHWWPGGMVVFDNGYHHDTVRSRLVEYTYDLDTAHVQLEWQYRDPDVGFVPLLGDVRRLPGGTRLGSWTSAGLLTEVDDDGVVVWRAEADLGAGLGRVTWIPDLYDLL